MESDDRHLRFPAVDIRLKDPMFMGQQIQKVVDDQKNYRKMYESLVENVAELAHEVLELKTEVRKERENSAEARSKIAEISANAEASQKRIEELTAEIEKMRGSNETVASIACPQVESSTRHLGHENPAGTISKFEMCNRIKTVVLFFV